MKFIALLSINQMPIKKKMACKDCCKNIFTIKNYDRNLLPIKFTDLLPIKELLL